MAVAGVRVLAGSVVQQDPTVLAAHLRLIGSQLLPDGVSLDFAFVDDNVAPESADLLRGVGEVLPARPKPPEAVYAVDDTTHRWNIATFHWLGAEKQRLLEHARAAGYDYFWLLDSDLLCDRTTLRSLLSVKAPIVNGVFWTRWQPGAAPMPQVWTRNPYEFDGLGMEPGDFLERLHNRRVVRTLGGGACTLFQLDRMAGACYSPPLPHLPQHSMWQGEDRVMAVTAHRDRVRQYADAWPDIFHAYHPADRRASALEEMEEILRALPQRGVSFGDWVSLRIEPLEEASMRLVPEVACVRGRLGGIEMLQEIEDAVFDMTPGERRVIEARFPSHWPLVQYRGQRKMLLVTLVDVKPHVGRIL